MAGGSLWRSRPVFLTSTFRDFHAERDHLRNVVFPALEERLRARRHHLEPIDLRWGVETAGEAEAQTKEMLVLKVCLAEVERSRPFLIGLLGDRYGWIPPKERIQAAAQEAGFEGEVTNRSVTDLEIDFGVLARPEQQQRCFFYFREPLPYDAMPKEIAADYSELHGEGGREGKTRIEALKQRIAKKLPDRIRRYQTQWSKDTNTVTGLEQWGLQVLEDLWTELNKETAQFAATAPSWQDQERFLLDQFIEDRSRHFIGREALIQDLLKLTTHSLPLPPGEGGGERGQTHVTWGICLSAASGAGKSALFAKLHRELSQQDVILLAHAAGISPLASQVDSILRRWIEELAQVLGIASPITEETKSDEVEQTFHRLLHQAAAKKCVILLIDALNQFEPGPRTQHLTWLPKLWPENARLIATAIPGPQTEALAKRNGVTTHVLTPLGQHEAEAISKSICARYRRTLNPEVLQALVTRKSKENELAAGNPLWLTLAVEELNLLDADDFTRAEKQFTGTPEQKLHQLLLTTAKGLPPTVPELYGRMLERAEELHGKHWADGFASLIAVSRFGWREQDFAQLLPKITNEPWDPLKFATLRRTFRAQVTQRGGQGQWDFAHAQLREAVLTQLLPDGEDRKQSHQLLADYLLALPKDDPVHESETMAHLIHADDKAQAAKYYGGERTQAEMAGATQALAVFIGTDSIESAGLTWACALLDTVNLEANERHALANHYNFDLHDALANLGVCRCVIEAAATALENLAERFPLVPQYQRDLSVSHEKLGDIHTAQGNLPAALEAYQATHSIRELLAQQDLSNSRWQHDLSTSQERLSRLYIAQGDLEAACKACEDALAIRERLTRQDPDNAEWNYSLTASYIWLGDLLAAIGKTPGALVRYQAAFTILNDLVVRNPTNTQWQRGLSVSCEKLGDTLKAQGKPAEAFEWYRASLSTREHLSHGDPGNTRWQHDLALLHGKLGDLFNTQGEWQEALKCYELYQAIQQRLAMQDPSNTEWKRDLATSFNRIGRAMFKLGNLHGALESFLNSLQIVERLAIEDPSNTVWQRDLWINIVEIGNILVVERLFPEALKRFEAALIVAERLAAKDPNNIQWQRDLCDLHIGLGDTMGCYHEALQHYEASLAIAERLVSKDPCSTESHNDLAVSLAKLATICQINHDKDQADGYWRRCYSILQNLKQSGAHLDGSLIELLESLSAEHGQYMPPDPGHPRWLKKRSESYSKMGKVLLARADMAGALKAFKSSLAVAERLVSLSPTGVENHHDLVRCNIDLAQFYEQWGQRDRAHACWRQCYETLDAMGKRGVHINEEFIQLFRRLESFFMTRSS